MFLFEPRLCTWLARVWSCSARSISGCLGYALIEPASLPLAMFLWHLHTLTRQVMFDGSDNAMKPVELFYIYDTSVAAGAYAPPVVTASADRLTYRNIWRSGASYK